MDAVMSELSEVV